MSNAIEKFRANKSLIRIPREMGKMTEVFVVMKEKRFI